MNVEEIGYGATHQFNNFYLYGIQARLRITELADALLHNGAELSEGPLLILHNYTPFLNKKTLVSVLSFNRWHYYGGMPSRRGMGIYPDASVSNYVIVYIPVFPCD